ncbi:MAG TPA: Ig-like domain-containing protein [Vicinamibacterales bacterium]|jgi:hypothetical protein
MSHKTPAGEHSADRAALVVLSFGPEYGGRTPVGGSTQLTAIARDSAGVPLLDAPAHFTSDHTNVARVDARTGLITGVSTGRALITATVGGVSAAIEILV